MNEAAYLRQRAERHRRLADRAHNAAARHAHEQMASAYEARAAELGARS